MSATLQLDESGEKTIDLGNPFELLKVFSEMSDLVDDARFENEFGDLFGVPEATMDNEPVDLDWLADVRTQAAKFLAEFEGKLTPDSLSVVQTLAGKEE